MAQFQDPYAAAAADWRGQLRKNTFRTRVVIGIFFLIYIAIGLLLDTYFHASGTMHVIQGTMPPQAPPTIGAVVISLITFQVIPWATLIMIGIAVISLLVTYSMYDKIMLLGTQYREVTEKSTNPEEKKLYNVIEEMKVAAGMRYMPKIFIIEADYMNAFASGYSEKSAMVAITQGLMNKLDRSELQAVMAHELSHIRHGDIKLTLTASVLTNIMLIVMDLLFYNALFSSRNRDSRGANVLFLIIIVVRFLLPVVTLLLMLYLSRTREYMADAGSVELQRDNEPMIRALMKIHGDHQANAEQYKQQYGATGHESVRRESYIYDPVKMGVSGSTSPSDWFSTHPAMDKRLAALGYRKTQHANPQE